MESTYEVEIAEPEQPDRDAPPTFIFLESADDDAACTVDGECV